MPDRRACVSGRSRRRDFRNLSLSFSLFFFSIFLSPFFFSFLFPSLFLSFLSSAALPHA